ncbi:hypothetical protein OUZ56_009658 [Daphnia magna]|uniref:Uncharacterized protein n=1 Tax=Daphnia magna TaxID=35525 RepID=A0ABR0AGM4_9CRUS|nr:hypothetical protein OUZ56_009658 [Daphnia magna]
MSSMRQLFKFKYLKQLMRVFNLPQLVVEQPEHLYYLTNFFAMASHGFSSDDDFEDDGQFKNQQISVVIGKNLKNSYDHLKNYI